MVEKVRLTDEQVGQISKIYNEYYQYMNDFERDVYKTVIRFKTSSIKQKDIMRNAYIECATSKYKNLDVYGGN